MDHDFAYDLETDTDLAEDPALAADGRHIADGPEVAVLFTYPLRRAVTRTLTAPAGLTRAEFAATVAREYAAIYAEEEASRTASPAPRGELMNRSETDGVHGIWGHDLADLVLEGASRGPDGVWRLGVGS